MRKEKRIAIYPGTFDPVTNGHLDILGRASRIFDEVIVALSEKTAKNTVFTLQERFDLLKKAIALNRFACPIHVKVFQGLLVKFAQKEKAVTNKYIL